MTVDVDNLPPTQYLILEVLAARHRLGEASWAFPDRLRPALRALETAGLIGWKSSPAPHAAQAWLTDAGRKAALSENYTPPVPRPPAGLMTYAEALAVLHPGIVPCALAGLNHLCNLKCQPKETA